MRLRIEPYSAQVARWPKAGRSILAQFDAETVVVYQAFRPEIASYAVTHAHFGGDFSLSRMSWIKPNFLWMMYRCGWASKENQESVLAIWLRRSAFDAILREAVPSAFSAQLHPTKDVWSEAVAASSVRLQWDPDHDPAGAPLERRAIQLGLRGAVLRSYARDWIVGIEDVTPFVRAQAPHASSGSWSELLSASEDVYPIEDPELRARLGIGFGEMTG